MAENSDPHRAPAGWPGFTASSPESYRPEQQSYPVYPSPQQHYPAAGRRRRAGRPMASVLAMVAAVALLVGGGAGYVGARLAQGPAERPVIGGPTQPAPAPTPSPVAHESPASTGSTSPDSADPDSSDPGSSAGKASADTVAIAAQLLPSTVTIRVTGSDGVSIGSGFVLDDHGRIMTNNHVVAGAESDGDLWVTNSAGHRARAELVGRSPAYDLAIIQVEDHRGLHPATLGDSSKVRIGEAAVAIGSPLGLGGTVTEGIISAVNRPVAVGDGKSADGQAYLNALQTDAPINHGNSGGPLADSSGAVIGVNSAILTGSGSSDQSGNIGIGFAIPINQARQIGSLLIDHGYATYPVIDATVSDDGNDDGVLLASLSPGGAAADAGLRTEDRIIRIDGQRVNETDDLIVAIRNHRPGDTVTLRYQRDGSEHNARVELGSERG